MCKEGIELKDLMNVTYESFEDDISNLETTAFNLAFRGKSIYFSDINNSVPELLGAAATARKKSI